MKDIQSLYDRKSNPFFAGFGNRVNVSDFLFLNDWTKNNLVCRFVAFLNNLYKRIEFEHCQKNIYKTV